MQVVNRTNRRAFSLLEMVLALAIGMVLLGALYYTFFMDIKLQQIGRDTLSEGAVARNILTRISNDILSQVGPVDPRVVASNSAAAASGSTTPSTSGSTTPSTSGASSNSGSSTGGAATSTAPAGNQVTFNIGVQGDSTNLTLSNYRIQKPSMDIMTELNPPTDNFTSDMRVICYWMANNGGNSQALARKEFFQATNDAINTYPSDLPDQDKAIFAEEVSAITFEYYDGFNWQTSWTGSTPATGDTYQMTPIGPPVAIRITLTLHRDMSKAARDQGGENEQGAQYQHIVALPSANFFQSEQ